jgi:hypothetical protein
LEKVQKEIKNEDVWYCPHRRNKDDVELLEILDHYNTKIFNTQVSVEYDFINKGLNPLYIAGFGSTALYTLKLIYPEAIVYNVYQHQTKATPSTIAYLKAYDEQLKKIGVNTLNLYNQ